MSSTQPVVQHCLQYLASRCGLHAQHFVSLPSLYHVYQSRQRLHSSQKVAHGSEATKGKETITVTFHDDKDGSTKTVQVPVGMSLLEAAHANDVDLEGACEGSLACSTCHVILEDPEVFAKLPEPTDDENDMLDLAFGLTDLSRLGCQIIASKDIDGIVVKIPSATRNFAVDGHIPKPH